LNQKDSRGHYNVHFSIKICTMLTRYLYDTRLIPTCYWGAHVEKLYYIVNLSGLVL
jgi:hypothetical protein